MTTISEAFADLSPEYGARLQRDLAKLPDAAGYLVAFSGGLDSQVLLTALYRYGLYHQSLSRSATRLRAIHVNHGLSPHADDWQRHCEARCGALGVELVTEAVCVSRDSAQGLEAAAREARYQAFATHLDEREVLLLAHHQNDQVETVLLNLMRGSGLRGLAGIPRHRSLAKGSLYRPLLDWSRLDLEHLAQVWQLAWVEDESNQSRDFDRNYLRHEIVPRLNQRWPATDERVAQTARWCRETEELLSALAAQDLKTARHSDNELRIAVLNTMTPARQRNLVRYWLEQNQCGYPGERSFERILTEVIPARSDAEPEVRWDTGSVRRYRDRLVLVWPENPVTPKRDALPWDCRSPVALPGGILRAALLTCETLLTCEARLLRIPCRDEAVTVRFRQGGEDCRPAPSGRLRPLKKLLQEWQVPPWLRAHLPLIYFNDVLVAVPGYMVAAGFEAQPAEQGVRLTWESALRAV
jgi:tRNA(Ile)-lysidine synthase